MSKYFFLFSCIVLLLFASGCSGSKESYDRNSGNANAEGEIIRVLLDEEPNGYSFVNESPLYLRDGTSDLAMINTGNTISVANLNDGTEIKIADRSFKGKDLQLVPGSSEVPVTYKGKSYSGTLNIVSEGSGIKIINSLSVEQYLKGVIPREMPSGKGNEYYEALKAFTICARTYTFSKINENKKSFDVFADTRDQVYGGRGIEKEMINDIVDETRGLILTYDDKPAMTFYHSTCGGYTEDASNVFPKIDVPYLKGVKDGDEPYCSVSPKYTWMESYSEGTFLDRLVSAKYLDNADYTIENITVNSTFKSGRIDELEIDLKSKFNISRTIKLYGNNIRYIIRTANNKSILESNNFTVRLTGSREVVLNGKGYGHGVGLCQWGALEQSVEGRDYEEILSFYYPGTKIESYNDQ